MASSLNQQHRLHLIYTALLVHLVASSALQQVAASSGGGLDAATAASSSSAPLWSYQAKPINHHVGASSQLLDTLSQRQGALSGSPFLSILPIILIAAGGMLLLLPFLTMMIASPFSGGLGGAFNSPGGFGYPQMVAALGKRRSLDGVGSNLYTGSGLGKGPLEIIDHVSSLIDEMTRKYSGTTSSAASAASKKSNASK